MTDYDYLIIGGGMVADAAAHGIRELDADGSIGILAAEADPPATRPALSKKLWTDPDFAFDQVWLGTEEDTGAVRHAGERAVAVDPASRTVRTDAGATYGYGRLLLATGGAPQRGGLPEDPRILTFRTVTDYRRLRELSGGGRSVAVVGGSYIGTELAAGLVQNDTATTLVTTDEVLGGSVFPVDLARRFQAMFTDHGVTVVTGAKAVGATVSEDGVRLVLEGHDGVVAGAVVVGLGVEPAVGYLEGSGLTVEDGVEVDERLQTSDPSIWAAGDIASYPDAILGRRRVEHVDNANQQGRQAGRNLAGADEAYTHTPYYYSAVFGVRYEAVGRLDSSLDTVEDWAEDGAGVVYYVDGERVAGVLLWAVAEQTDAARTVIRDTVVSDPAALRGRIPTA